MINTKCDTVQVNLKLISFYLENKYFKNKTKCKTIKPLDPSSSL